MNSQFLQKYGPYRRFRPIRDLSIGFDILKCGLFVWRLPKEYDFSYFPWNTWYIWENLNDTIHKNKDENPQELLHIAGVEGTLWAEAQLSDQQKQNKKRIHHRLIGIMRLIPKSAMLIEHGEKMTLLQARGGSVKSLAQKKI